MILLVEGTRCRAPQHDRELPGHRGKPRTDPDAHGHDRSRCCPTRRSALTPLRHPSKLVMQLANAWLCTPTTYFVPNVGVLMHTTARHRPPSRAGTCPGRGARPPRTGPAQPPSARSPPTCSASSGTDPQAPTIPPSPTGTSSTPGKPDPVDQPKNFLTRQDNRPAAIADVPIR